MADAKGSDGRSVRVGDAVRDAGSARDGLLLWAIRQWYRYANVKKSGQRWLVKSAAEFGDITGLSESQVHHAMASLNSKNLIFKERHRWYAGGEIVVFSFVRPRFPAVDTAAPGTIDTAVPGTAKTAVPGTNEAAEP